MVSGVGGGERWWFGWCRVRVVVSRDRGGVWDRGGE